MARRIAVLLVLALLGFLLYENAQRRKRPVRAVPEPAAQATTADSAPDETVDRAEGYRRSFELERELMAELEEQAAEVEREGFVRNAAGEPVEDAAVDFGQRTMLTDSDGRFSFEWEEGESLTFRIRHRDYLDAQFERKRDDEELVFVLEAGQSIRGVLVYPGGQPLPGERIRAWCERTGEVSEATTDAKGRFELTGLPPGPCIVSASGVFDALKTRAGDHDVRLVPLFSRVQVTVVGAPDLRVGELDLDGDLLARVRVIARNVDTGERDALEVEGNQRRFTPRSRHGYKIIVSARGCRPAIASLPETGDRLFYREIRIRPEPIDGVTLQLDVREADGSKAESFKVGVLDRDGDLLRVETRSYGASFSGSEFELDGLEPGAVRIRVWQSANEELVREMTVDAATKPGKPRRVDLPDGARVRVRGGAQGIGIRSELGERRLRVVRDEGDWITASKLPRGRYRIEQREFPGKLVHDEVVDVVPGPEIVVEWPE